MKTWMPLQNPILNATENNFFSAMGISTYHDSALAAAKSDPFFQELFNYFHPFHLGYKTAYDKWMQQGGKQQSETLNLTQLLGLLSNKIKHWDIKIQNQYPQSTPEYKYLLPNRRKPFQSGGQIDRIHAVQVLSQAIGSDESLVAVKTDIDNFNTLLQAALTSQKENISLTKTESANLETARVAMCTAQYADLGSMIKKYAATPELIEPYFDLQAIRKSQQVLFTGHVNGGGIYTIVRHTFDDADQITLTNPGTAQLKFYLAPSGGMQPGSQFIALSQGVRTVLASELGDLSNTCLTVLNTDPLHNAEFSVELL